MKIKLTLLSIVVATFVARAASAQGGPLADAAIAQVILPSHDLDRSLHFYRDQLGMKLLFRVPGAVFFDASGMRLRLEPARKASDVSNIAADDNITAVTNSSYCYL